MKTDDKKILIPSNFGHSNFPGLYLGEEIREIPKIQKNPK
jgi:hypothetical protein